MSMTTPGPMRLLHNAFITDDQEATRKFYEDVIGMPLVATWAEKDVLLRGGADLLPHLLRPGR